MSKRTKTIISLVLNAIVATVTAGIAVSYFFNHTDVIPNGWVSFRFFTTDANLLAAIGSLLVMICDIQILRGKRENVARAFTLVKYAGVVGLLLTFCVVMVLLVPIYGAARQLGGTSFHMHVTAPLLTFVSFVFFDAHTTLRFRDTFIGLLPEVLYGLFYFCRWSCWKMVGFLRLQPGRQMVSDHAHAVHVFLPVLPADAPAATA